ncbi:MAG TPA: PRC-barrel domain-containing protein [Anaerolineaceae bacterium]|nr:PRC-barrel domain-containing protein [Anaerolineaceae bacterium]
MKKTWLFGVLVILALVLAACGGAGETEGTETVGEGLGTEMAETEAPGLVATEPVGGGVATAVPVETEEPMATATRMVEPTTAAGGGGAATAVGTAVGTGVPATGGPVNDDFLLCTVMDYDVQDANGEDLGDVNDFVLDAAGNRIQYVVVGAGGFLGIGEQDLLVPFDQFTINREEPDDNDRVLVFNGDTDRLSNAPVVNLDELDFSVPGWGDEYDAYWAGAGTTAGTPVATVEPMPQATAGAVGTAVPATGEDMETTDQDFVLASELCGAWVVDETTFGTFDAGTINTVGTPRVETMTAPTAGVVTTPGAVGTVTGPVVNETAVAPGIGVDFDQIGEVNNVVMDPETGNVTYLIVDPDDDLIEDDVWVPVPLMSARIVNNINTDEPHDVLVLIDATRLKDAPSIEADHLPDLTVNGWDDDYVGFWGVTR